MAIHKPKHRTAVIISVVVVLVVSAAAYIFYSLRDNIKQYAIGRITQAVQQEFGVPYSVDMGNISFSLVSGKVTVTGFAVAPDSAKLDSMRSAGHAPHTLYVISSRRVVFELHRQRENIRNDRLEIHRIDIEQPRVEIMRDSALVHNAPERDSTALVKLPFRSITVRSINVYDGYFAYSRVRTDDTVRHTFNRVSLKVERIVIDSTMNLRELKLPPIYNLHCRLGESIHSADRSYSIGIKRSEFDLLSGSLTVDTLSLIPRYGKMEFPLKTRRHSDWTLFNAERIAINGIDLDHLIKNRALEADSLILTGTHVESFKNRKAPVPPKVKPLFHQMLQRAGIPISVHRVEVHGGSAVYEEMPVKGDVAGAIEFDSIEMAIDSFTNIVSEETDYLDINARARVMQQGAIDAHFRLSIDPGNQHFAISGSLGSMELKRFNPMVEPLAHIGVNDGRVTKLYFTMEGNDRSGIINMNFQYERLRINILNKIGARSWLGSSVVNSMVITGDNPQKGKEVRQVSATAVRDPYRSNFNYWWRMIFEGVKESVGLTQKRQQQITNLQNELKQMKQAREERRKKRKEKQ